MKTQKDTNLYVMKHLKDGILMDINGVAIWGKKKIVFNMIK